MRQDVLWLLLLVPLLASLGVQQLLRSTFRRYRAVRNHAGLTGEQTARALLDAHDLQRVGIQAVPGFLTDNYDGERKMLSLSRRSRRCRRFRRWASPRTRSRTP